MKTNMVVSGSNPQEVSYAFTIPVNRCLEQASTYEMGMRKPVSFQASVILSTVIRICGIPKEMVLDTYHSTGRNSNIDSITIKKHVL